MRFRVHSIDKDPVAAAIASQVTDPNFKFYRADFADLNNLIMNGGLLGEGRKWADAFIFDIGVSSMQLDDSSRGFSFVRNGPLDMRMNPEGEAISAFDIINWSSEAELFRIFLDVIGYKCLFLLILSSTERTSMPKY